MTGILNPATGRTTRHERFLATLMDWTSETRINRAMIEAGIARPKDLLRCALDVQATVESPAPAGLTEEQCANRLLLFLQSRNLRRVIAAYMESAHMKPRADAIRELRALQDELATLVREEERRREMREGGLICGA